MSLLNSERPEYRVPLNVPSEVREFVAQEYPGESLGWVIRVRSSHEHARRHHILGAILARFGRRSLRADPSSTNDCTR